MSKQMRFILVCMSLAGTAMLHWTCGVEKIGLQDPTSIDISEIVAELATSRRKPQLEFAINLLFNKTGVGRQIKGSRYFEYNLPEDFVARLAEEQLQFFQDSEWGFTWAELFEIEEIALRGDTGEEVDFPLFVSRFQAQAEIALGDPESPDNALILAILAVGPNMPTTVRFDQNYRLSPVQDFLLTAWLTYEFPDIDSLEKGIKKVKFKVYTVACAGDDPAKIDEIGKNSFKVEPLSENQRTCLKARKKVYKRLRKDCLRKKGKKNCSTEVKPCLEEPGNARFPVPANQFLHDWIYDTCVHVDGP